MCCHFSRLCVTDHQQDKTFLKKFLSGAEEVGGVDIHYLLKCYKLFGNVDLLKCETSNNDEKESIKRLEIYFEKFENVDFVIYDGKKKFFLASESTPKKVLQNRRNFMDGILQPNILDQFDQHLEHNFEIESSSPKESCSSSGFYDGRWSGCDEWDFFHEKYRKTYAKLEGKLPERLILPPTPEELADDYDPWA